MCAVSPGQIPFWLGWSAILYEKKVLLPRSDHYNVYIIGIGIGTFIGNCLFIFGGLLIAGRISRSQDIFNWIIGGIFLATALYQAWRMLRKKDPVQKIIHPEEMKPGMEKKFKRIIKRGD